jgi:glycosyltransferase involved in cell wall biosynthesis
MLKVAFVCPAADISGGVNVIFRHVMGLLEAGVQVAIVSKFNIETEQLSWHPIRAVVDHPNLLWLDFNTVSGHRFDIAIATWWRSFFDLWKIESDAYLYFVQSIESRFYPLSERVLRAAAEATYESRIGYITEAKWIGRYLRKMHGQEACVAPNGIDKTIFTADGDAVSDRIPGTLRVLVEGAVDAEFKNVPSSIRLAREGGADEVWLLTPSCVDRFPGVDRVFSRVPQEFAASVYRSCDIVLKLSLVEGMFGPPLEMFHCGGAAIVYDVTGHDEYIRHGHNALVAPMHDEAAVRRYIRQLKSFPPLLDALKMNALATASEWPDWGRSTSAFLAGLIDAARHSRMTRTELGRFSGQIWHFVECHWRDLAEARASSSRQVRLSPQEFGKATGESGEGNESSHLERQLAAMRSSSSWRLTRPLRGLKRVVSEPDFARYMLQRLVRRVSGSSRV